MINVTDGSEPLSAAFCSGAGSLPRNRASRMMPAGYIRWLYSNNAAEMKKIAETDVMHEKSARQHRFHVWRDGQRPGVGRDGGIFAVRAMFVQNHVAVDLEEIATLRHDAVVD